MPTAPRSKGPRPKKPSRKPLKKPLKKSRKAIPELRGPAGPARDGSEVRNEGFRELTWGGFDALAQSLVKKLGDYDPELVIGVVKGGLFVGSAVAGLLRREFIPVRLSKRSRDRERLSPEVRTEVPIEARGKRVLVVDDVVQSGDTLRQAIAAIAGAGARDVRSAALVVHGSRPKAKAYRPDWFALETDDLVVFPWDYELRSVGASDLDPGESGV